MSEAPEADAAEAIRIARVIGARAVNDNRQRRSDYPDPVLGPHARATMKWTASHLPPDSIRRRKLLVLLAAYADAGVADPPFSLLMPRLKVGPFKLDHLLKRLELDGLLAIDWGDKDAQQANRYQLLFLP